MKCPTCGKDYDALVKKIYERIQQCTKYGKIEEGIELKSLLD